MPLVVSQRKVEIGRKLRNFLNRMVTSVFSMSVYGSMNWIKTIVLMEKAFFLKLKNSGHDDALVQSLAPGTQRLNNSHSSFISQRVEFSNKEKRDQKVFRPMLTRNKDSAYIYLSLCACIRVYRRDETMRYGEIKEEGDNIECWIVQKKISYIK